MKKTNKYEFMIAWRFLVKGRFQTLLIILGISMGVAVQLFLSALIGGLQISLIDKTVGAAPHITVMPVDTIPKKINNTQGNISDNKKVFYSERREIFSWQQYVMEIKTEPGVEIAAPVVNGPGFAEKGDTVVPVAIKGVSAEGLGIYRIKEKLLAGGVELSGENILMGKAIAERLAAATGDKIFLRNEKGEQVLAVVCGIFDLGSDAANKLVLVSLDRARSFFSFDGISAIEIRVKDVFAAENTGKVFKKKFSNVKTESWQEKNRELLSALRSQSSSSGTIQFFVLISISLAIASVLGIAAVQKSRQLGILKAMGATDRSAAGIFVIEGALLGVSGAFLGVFAGLGLSVLFMSATDASARFGLEITAANILTPAALAVIASVISASIPARRAAKLTPVEVIRNG
jgi:lipoprotein-releasing system permease protein